MILVTTTYENISKKYIGHVSELLLKIKKLEKETLQMEKRQ